MNNERIKTFDPTALTAFISRFFNRIDIHARQKRDGHYAHRDESVTHDLIRAHLSGNITLGTFCLSLENRAKYAVIDADERDVWQTLLTLARNLNIPTYLEQSRRGGHLWLFFEQPIAGQEARAFTRGLLAPLSLPGIEIYPRQRELRDGPGSLIRLPFGFHRKVEVPGQPGKRYWFQTQDGNALAPTIHEQLFILAYAQAVPQAFLTDTIENAPPERQPPPATEPFHLKPTSRELPLSERIKGCISVFDFVKRYVELDEHGIGFCPFHDDERPSFGVNQTGNYWSCWAGCTTREGNKGGSIIDFWMMWRRQEGQDDSFKITIKDLAQILGI